MKKKPIDRKIVITAIIGIVWLETVALLMGINGILLTTIIAVLAAAIGITIPNPLTNRS